MNLPARAVDWRGAHHTPFRAAAACRVLRFALLFALSGTRFPVPLYYIREFLREVIYHSLGADTGSPYWYRLLIRMSVRASLRGCVSTLARGYVHVYIHTHVHTDVLVGVGVIGCSYVREGEGVTRGLCAPAQRTREATTVLTTSSLTRRTLESCLREALLGAVKDV